MSKRVQTTRTRQEVGGFIGFLRDSFQTGMTAVEGIHQAAAEIPLNIVESLGVSKDQTQVFKDKHRTLIHGVYGPLNSIAGQLAEVSSAQVSLLKAALFEQRSQSGGAAKARKPKPGKGD